MRTVITVTLLLAVAACAHAGSWKVVQDQFATIAAALAFTTATDGIAPIADNGQGSSVLYTSSAGVNWSPVGAPATLTFLGAAAQGESAVISDMFSLYHSYGASYNFTSALLETGITSQNVEAFAGTYYAATGQGLLGGGNGVAVSADSGAVFAFINVSELTTDARYGAFPSTTTWFLSAGQWPDNNQAEDENSYYLTSRLRISRSETTAKVQYVAPRVRTANDNSSVWAAQIVKTSDGGKTWESVFSDVGRFYFNQISCASETHCVAVGESDNTSPAPGVRFYTTTDGGKTWNKVYSNTNPDMSVLACTALSTTEIWAAGGLLSETAFSGYFWHSTDFGQTWEAEQVPDVYGAALSFPTSTNGFATAFNAESTSSFLAYA